MRRSIALVLSASLFLLMAGEARAATVDISIVGVSAGFDPTAATGAIGDTFHWTNNDGITHTTTQNGPLSLWNSGNSTAGNAFSKAIDFAGSYPYHCSIHTSMTGTVKVPIQVTPIIGERGNRLPRHRRVRGRPERVRLRRPAQEREWELDGVEGRDHLEVRDVQAAGLWNLVVPLSPSQVVERREERLVAGSVGLGDVVPSGLRSVAGPAPRAPCR
jgi:plastocyanin